MTFKWLDRRTAAPGPYLTLVRSERDFNAAARKIGVSTLSPWVAPPPLCATAHYFNNPRDSERVCIIAINVTEKHTSLEIAGLLVHEAVHVVQEYFAAIGEGNPGREQEAYAVQMVSQELMAEYARQIGIPT